MDPITITAMLGKALATAGKVGGKAAMVAGKAAGKGALKAGKLAGKAGKLVGKKIKPLTNKPFGGGMFDNSGEMGGGQFPEIGGGFGGGTTPPQFPTFGGGMGQGMSEGAPPLQGSISQDQDPLITLLDQRYGKGADQAPGYPPGELPPQPQAPQNQQKSKNNTTINQTEFDSMQGAPVQHSELGIPELEQYIPPELMSLLSQYQQRG